MKHYLMIFPLALLLASCTGKQAPKGTFNVVSLTDDGHTYSDTTLFVNGGVVMSDNGETAARVENNDANNTGENTPENKCMIRKADNQYYLTLQYFHTRALPASATLTDMPGPANGTGIGTYKTLIAPADTTNNFFTEYSGSTTPYHVDSAVVNITKASGNEVQGTYTLWLSGGSATKKQVTGILSWNNKI